MIFIKLDGETPTYNLQFNKEEAYFLLRYAVLGMMTSALEPTGIPCRSTMMMVETIKAAEQDERKKLIGEILNHTPHSPIGQLTAHLFSTLND